MKLKLATVRLRSYVFFSMLDVPEEYKYLLRLCIDFCVLNVNVNGDKEKGLRMFYIKIK